jgi:hypothetical protein
VLALVTIAGCLGLVHAEVSTDGSNQRPLSTLLLDFVVGITDGADPIPQLRWNPYRKIQRTRMLNPDGAIRRDGRPDVAFHSLGGWPFAVWAYNNGTEHDIAFAHWQGDRWSETEFLTFDTLDHVDPRIFISEHNVIHVVWAVRGDDPRILHSSGRPGDVAWSGPHRMTLPGEVVSRPTVATSGTVSWIAYEQVADNDGTPTPHIVVRSIDERDVVSEARVFPSERRAAMDPVIHANSGRVWLDWKFADDRFAWVMLDGPAAGEVRFVPWTDGSWLGVEDARARIQGLAMGDFRTIDGSNTANGQP